MEPAGNFPKYRAFGRYRKYLDPIVSDPLIRGYFEILATIILVSLLIVFAIRPTLNTVSGLIKKGDDLTALDLQLSQKIQNLISAQSTYARFEPQIELLTRALPASPQVETAVTDFQNIAKINNSILTSIDVDKTGLTSDGWTKNSGFKQGSVVPLHFSLTTTDDFSNAKKFLEKIVNTSRIYTVDSVSFSSGKKTADKTPGTLTVNYSGNTYFLP